MAGHRVGRAARIEQWRQRHRQRMSQAGGDVERVGAAADHLRLALKYTTPEQRKRISESVCTELAATADELLTAYETGRKAKATR